MITNPTITMNPNPIVTSTAPTKHKLLRKDLEDLEALVASLTAPKIAAIPPKNLASYKVSKPRKIGTIYANAKALNLTPEQARNLSRIGTASDLRKQWDYRALGFKIEDARCALAKASTQASYHRKQSSCYDAYQYCPRVRRYLKEKEKRMCDRRVNLSLIGRLDEAQSLDEIHLKTNGFRYGYGCVVSIGGNALVIERDEHKTWSDRKSWTWPTSQSTEYSLTHISAQGDTLAAAKLDSRKGDWLGKVGIALGLQTAKRSPITLTASMVPVREFSKLNVQITELRLYGVGFSAFCASRGDTHFHASTVREAIMGLARKIKAHQQNLRDDSEVITLNMAKKMGFCPMGISLFCEQIGWQGVKSATAGAIREAIRDIDVTPWVHELVALGIIPPCDKS
jgi:hypothetical protein